MRTVKCTRHECPEGGCAVIFQVVLRAYPDLNDKPLFWKRKASVLKVWQSFEYQGVTAAVLYFAFRNPITRMIISADPCPPPRACVRPISF